GGAGGESLLYVVWPANGARHRTNGRHRAAVRPERAVDFYRDLPGLNAGLPANRRCGFRDSDWPGVVLCGSDDPRGRFLPGGNHPQDDPAYRAAVVPVRSWPAAAGDEPDVAGVRSADRVVYRPAADLH